MKNVWENRTVNVNVYSCCALNPAAPRVQEELKITVRITTQAQMQISTVSVSEPPMPP